jgi:hypothetical protein
MRQAHRRTEPPVIALGDFLGALGLVAMCVAVVLLMLGPAN